MLDYTDTFFNPTATDNSIRLVIAISLAYAVIGCICDLFDVEGVFLNLEMENVMYIKCPPGMVELGFMTQEEFDTTCVELKMAIYGNVDTVLIRIRVFTVFLV